MQIEHHSIESCLSENDDVIALEVKYALKAEATNEIATIVGEAPDEALRKSLHNAPSGVWSTVYNIFETVVFELLRNDGVGEILETHTAKYFYTDAAGQGLSNRFLTSTSFMPPLATVAKGKMNTSMEMEVYSVA